ncbi:hypothetical protein U3516DRAFT_859387 [Neocallimastix sp. 'constans']
MNTINGTCPEYNSIKSQISRNLNKKLPSNMKILRYSKILIIFQSPFLAKLYSEYDDIFDSTFFIAPKFTISNLPFINPEYIFDIYVKIKSIKNNYCQFLKFLEYFYKTYLVGYDMKVWNYLITHVIYAFGCILNDSELFSESTLNKLYNNIKIMLLTWILKVNYY